MRRKAECRGYQSLTPTCSLYLFCFLILFITQPRKRAVKSNVNWPRSVWCHFDWQDVGNMTFFMFWKQMLTQLQWLTGGIPLIRCRPRAYCAHQSPVGMAHGRRQIKGYQTVNQNDTKLSATAFYRRFLGWVKKKLKREGQAVQVGMQSLELGMCHIVWSYILGIVFISLNKTNAINIDWFETHFKFPATKRFISLSSHNRGIEI